MKTTKAPLSCSRICMFLLLSFLIAPLTWGISWAAPPQEGKDQTLSPYFFVQGADSETDALPLKSTQAEVRIAGVTADVTVTQVYKNEGKNTLEAIYVFPGSTRAAVYAMKMTIGERIIEARIMERQKARETYETAKKEGKTASLLEQQRPNVFQMNVANILPGDQIQVQLKYTELLEPDEGVYEFVYPAVVGPRYSDRPQEGAPSSETWVQNPYVHSGEKPPYGFDISVQLNTGVPIQDITSPNGGIKVDYLAPDQASISLGPDPKAGTRDFVLRYRLAGGQIETGLLLYPGQDENFFLLMLQPPERPKAETILPREYIFIIDVSGSMNGFPLNEVAKPMITRMIEDLRPVDLFNMVQFAGGSNTLSDSASLPATEANKRQAISWLKATQGGGGTQILPALKKALNLPRAENISRTVVVITDGYVSVEPEVFELIRSSLSDANLFAFGIGSSVNRFLIEGMARAGLGVPFVALNPEQGIMQAQKFRRYIENPVLTNIKVQFDGFDAYDVEPAAVPDLFAQRPIIVQGKYRGETKGWIKVSGESGTGPFQRSVNVAKGFASKDNAAIRLLWARGRIMALSDLNLLRSGDQRIKDITELGLQYGLMTQYTSFVAVDKIRRADGRVVTVKQPLPMPEGVSDLAVGNGGRAMVKMAPSASRPSSSFLGLTSGSTPPPPPKKTESLAQRPESKEPAPVLSSAQADAPAGGLVVTMVELRGGLDRTSTDRFLKNLSSKLQACLKGQAQSVEITFRMVIGASGQVTKVETASVSANGQKMAQCWIEILKKQKFPNPGGQEAELVVRIARP